MGKRWLLMSSREKNSHLVQVLTKFQDGGRFTAEAVTKALKKEFPGISFYNGTAMSVAGRLAKLGFQRWDEKDPESKMHFWSWPTPPVTIPAEEPLTPEVKARVEERAEEVGAQLTQMDGRQAFNARYDGFESYLKSKIQEHTILHESADNEFPGISAGRGRQAQEALIFFRHYFKALRTQ